MRLLVALLLFLAVPTAAAQLLPDLTGDALLDALADDYAPTSVLSSSQSKDRLYDTVDAVTLDGTEGVLGFYTGFFVPFDGVPSTDPSQDVFNNEAGLNQEHLWPRSEGTDNNDAETDLHHLVPTRVRVNSDRASLSFGEIPDAQASAWYLLDQTQSNTPDADRDAYSERSRSAFEPRETVKGDVARALFYVATIYEAEVGASGQAWFERQLSTLLAWHAADPADDAEVARSARVAAFQGTDNPYVLDATLARRAFAPEGVVRYVNAGVAEGTRGGSTWQDAFANPADALAAARAGDEVWIAAGTYTPTDTDDRSISFTVPDGVALYGGFAGTESTREDAAPDTNPTTLSGDIGLSGDDEDNSYHVVVAGGTLTLDGLVIAKGNAGGDGREGSGGGLLVEVADSVVISRTTFTSNRAQRGAGLYASTTIELQMESILFEGNAADLFGGGGFVSGPACGRRAPITTFLNARGLTLRDNSASAGGGLYLCNATMTADALVLDGNTASGGGGMQADLSTVTLLDPLVQDNVAEEGGGILWVGDGGFEPGVSIEGGLFEGNVATSNGGGVALLSGGRLDLQGTVFEGNQARQGGAVAGIPANALMVNARFTRNVASQSGGALYLAGSEGLVALSRFEGNRAEKGRGGALATDLASGLDLVGNAFVGNQSAQASALVLSDRVSAHANTLASNTAVDGTLLTFEVGTFSFTNSIVWENEGSGINTDNLFPDSNELVIRNVLYEDGVPLSDVITATGVITSAPLFVRAPSPGADAQWGTEDDDYGDLRLQGGSPALNVGDASLLPADTFDLDGDGDTSEPIPFDLDGMDRVLGEALDLGAYESPFGVAVAPEETTASRIVGPYPNPASDAATFALTLDAPQPVRIAVYDRLGRHVAVLHDGLLAAGSPHVFTLRAASFPAGIYLLRATGPAMTVTRRLTLVR